MVGPVLVTERASMADPDGRATTRTVVSGVAYLRALPSRLTMTRRRASAGMATSRAGVWRSTSRSSRSRSGTSSRSSITEPSTPRKSAAALPSCWMTLEE
jgi:hypothetical protein